MQPASPRRPATTPNSSAPQLKVLARACQICRSRKTKCDTQRPRCGTCITHNRHCVYALEPPKRRPSTTLVNALLEEKASLERCIIALKFASAEERADILNSISVSDGKVTLSGATVSEQMTDVSVPTPARNAPANPVEREDGGDASSDDDGYDHSNFLSMDERGQVGVYGPTSALHGPSPMRGGQSVESEPSETLRNQLIANAAIQRQKEHKLRAMASIGGEPSELALHLLDLHWNRQHHTFLLTYRPAIMRDLVTKGPWCSDFLLSAIFACVSKFSDRVEVRDDPTEPRTAGRRFFVRCEEMLAGVLGTSSIPTIVGLLMLGSTFNARGLTSKGWLYTGYALRMVSDLGLHLNCEETAENAEETEIRRRVFWGAFICDKLQSLYLGRSVTIQLQDAHVPRNFLDTFEENELWTPYMDPKFPVPDMVSVPTPTYSVSAFQQLCLLSKIMTRVINRFYVVGATVENTKSHLQPIDDALSNWYRALPLHLRFEPWTEANNHPPVVAPNVITLLTTYNALIILLHRPFIFDGHLRPEIMPAASRERCSIAARNVTSLATNYQNMHSFRRAPYLLSYAVYVACTIHARNLSASNYESRSEYASALITSLQCLDELTVPNSGVSNPAGTIRRLAEKNGIPNSAEIIWDTQTPNSAALDALCRMFPATSPSFNDFTQPQSLTSFNSFGYNPWEGFMDIYMPPLNDDLLDPKDGTS